MWWCHYLLTQWAVAKLLQAIELIGLTQEGVEGLCCPVDCGGVGRDWEGSNQAHLLQGGVTTSRLIQELVVFQVFREPLQHRQRLVEVYLSRVAKKTWDVQLHESNSDARNTNTYRHGDFGQLLSNAVLHDAPQIEGVVGLVWDASAPPSAGLQLLPWHIITARWHLQTKPGEKEDESKAQMRVFWLQISRWWQADRTRKRRTQAEQGEGKQMLMVGNLDLVEWSSCENWSRCWTSLSTFWIYNRIYNTRWQITF